MGEERSNQIAIQLIGDILKYRKSKSTATSDSRIFRIYRAAMPLVF